MAIIALIATPIILGIIKDVKAESNKRSIDGYAKALKNAIVAYQLENDNAPTSFEDIESYIEYDGAEVECATLEIYEDGMFYLSQCEVNNEDVEYSYGEERPYTDAAGVSVNIPTGITPVIYNGTNWEIVSRLSKWFDYENQEWANAVILNDNVSNKAGTELNVATDVKAMFVYIPRYEYKIEGDYGIHTDGTEGTQSLPGEIKVNFIPKSQTVASSTDYIVHPAFTFGNEELEGIWVGKFETSHSDQTKSETSLGCTDEKCTSADNLRILPNVVSLRSNSVSNFHYGIRSMSRVGNSFGIEDDTHMMKNSEWGAVAYLSQSKYGKYGNSDYSGENKEIYQNKSGEYKTGMSNGTPSQDTRNTQCEYNDTTNNCGVGASTTGNITGVYDMSGGASEYVMGNYNNVLRGSGFSNLTSIDSKYYETYTTYGTNDIGHALSETSTQAGGNFGWYNDYSLFVSSSYPWFTRGGYQGGGTNVGVFNFSFAYYTGAADVCSSARVVLVESN